MDMRCNGDLLSRPCNFWDSQSVETTFRWWWPVVEVLRRRFREDKLRIGEGDDTDGMGGSVGNSAS